MDETEKDIYDKVCQIFEDVAEIDRSAISPESTVAGDLAVDSLKLVEMTLEIQEEFHISVRDERIKDLTTVSDVVTLIREAMVAVA
jgi:acyl carrier protein